MIRISTAVQGNNFHFNAEGVKAFVEAFKNLSAGRPREIGDIPFTDKEGTETLRRLLLNTGPRNTFKIGKREITLTIEPEDVEYSMELFENSSVTKTFRTTEWLQCVNLRNGKGWYLYVFLEGEG